MTTSGPRKNMMIGLTHSREGLPIIVEDKAVKVGIGLPRGKAVDLWVDNDGMWNIRQGNAVSGKLTFKTVAKVKTRSEAEAEFRKAYEAADLCGHPRKIPYFGFFRTIMTKDGEVYIPDFGATEAYSFADPKHPGAPTEIDIMFLNTTPFQGQFAMWGSSELRCSGDGLDANRSVLMYDDEKKVPEPMREAWKAAKAAGQRTFIVSEGCWSCECPFSKEKDGKPSPCKPSGDLRFQLLRHPKPGGTAFFHTSGYRSIRQLFSAVESIKELTGGKIYGIPLKMVLRSHVTNHAGIKAIQNNVTLRPREEDKAVWDSMLERAWRKYTSDATSLPEPTKMLALPEPFDETPLMSAKAMGDEFYIDNDESDESDPVTTTNSPATQAASTAKATEIGEALAKAAEPQSAQPSNVVSIAPGKAPWADAEKPRVRMTEMYQVMLKGLGKPVYDDLLTKHGLNTGAPMKFDSAEAAACYREMALRLKEIQGQATTAASQPDVDRPLF